MQLILANLAQPEAAQRWQHCGAGAGGPGKHCSLLGVRAPRGKSSALRAASRDCDVQAALKLVGPDETNLSGLPFFFVLCCGFTSSATSTPYVRQPAFDYVHTGQ